jgi:hypothetical protein
VFGSIFENSPFLFSLRIKSGKDSPFIPLPPFFFSY